ncbi:NlpC/P60 family protein [Streptomyces canus]|uniref:NlpC/P60 family protein n=1 Tax=Streptomyces canus TaxID=58343 RepID=UPI000362599B|nr:NlpC/P60 family protein [Streptomyces canus]
MSEYLTIAEAAHSLGVSEPTVRTWIRQHSLTASPGARGLRIEWAEVMRVIKERRDEALGRLPYDAEGVASFAAQMLWPLEDHEERTPRGRITIEKRRSTDVQHAKEALGGLLVGDSAAVLGHASLHAAARPSADGCRWCAARAIAYRLRALPPADKPEYRTLFGSEPCEADRRAWARQAQLTARDRREREATSSAGKSLRLQALNLAELKIGAPFKLNAAGPTAFDCSGLVHWAFAQAAGVDVPRTRTALLAFGRRIAVEEAQPGDLVLADGAPNHVAIVADGGHVIHADHGGVQYGDLTDRRWSTALRIGS